MAEDELIDSSIINTNDKWILNVSKEEAIERLMDMYGEEIKRLVYTYTKNWAQTEDITQEVFVSVFMKLDTFQGRSLLRSWIYSIAINKCKDYLRSWNVRNVKIADKLFSTIKSTDSPELHVIYQNTHSAIAQKVLSLPIKYREVIILFYYKEMHIDEICKVLGINQSTVKTRLKRGRDKLKLTINRGDLNE